MSAAWDLVNQLDVPGLFWGVASIDEPVDLDPIEAQAVARAIPKRQAEFGAGRLAARRAFEAAKLPPAPVPMAQDRSPIWPDGAMGSITHAGGHAVCALTRAPFTVGVDLETNQILDQDLVQSICFDGDEGNPLAVFSAKEAAYKAAYPLCRVVFGFDGLRIRNGCARFVDTEETRAIPHALRARDWPVRQAHNDGLILSLCVTQI